MSNVYYGLGIVSVLILFGIIGSGSIIENNNVALYNDDINKIDIDYLVSNIDVNITNSVMANFNDMNISPGFKQTIKYIAKSITYGVFVDLYVGVTINEYFPNLYPWLKENILFVIICIIFIINPELIYLLFMVCLFIVFIVKERFFANKKIKNIPWRD
jgi:hypothetical protein